MLDFLIELIKGFLAGNCALIVLCTLELFFLRRQYVKHLKAKQEIMDEIGILKTDSNLQREQFVNTKPFWKSSIGGAQDSTKRKSFINVGLLQSADKNQRIGDAELPSKKDTEPKKDQKRVRSMPISSSASKAVPSLK